MDNEVKVSNRAKLAEYVSTAFSDYRSSMGFFHADQNTIDHVVRIGISILETKYPEIGPGYIGGGFVQAVVQNDLMGAMGSADYINRNQIHFYCVLLYNFNVNSIKKSDEQEKEQGNII